MAWYVLFGITMKEEKLCSQIKAVLIKYIKLENIILFVPKRNIVEYHRGSWIIKEKVLFPGYVFINLNEKDINILYDHIQECSLLIKILMCENTYYILQKDDLELIQWINSCNGVIELFDLEKDGEFYIIRNSVIANQIEVLKVNLRKKRCKVLIDFNKKQYIMDIGINKVLL